MKLKLILIVTCIINLLSAPNYAQEIHFGYDPSGNRITREYFIVRLSADSVYQIQNSDTLNVEVFPNPVDNIFQIRIESEYKKETKYSIIDISGKLLLSEWLKNQLTDIDIANLSSGVYYLEVKSGDQKKLFKLVKN